MKRRNIKAGLPPGTLLHVGEQKVEKVSITEISYNGDTIEKKEIHQAKDLQSISKSNKNRWINVEGIHDPDVVSVIGNTFNIHPLIQEDILNTTVRPKVTDFDNCVYITLKILDKSEGGLELEQDQISLILGDKWLISFQEKHHLIFNNLLERLMQLKGNLPLKGVDYLLFRILDTIVDHYSILTETVDDVIISLEEKIIEEFDETLKEEIFNAKKQIVSFRKLVYPVREALTFLSKENTPFISNMNLRYFSDVNENIGQILETIDSEREMLSSVMDLYQAGVSNKMNQVMQLLTIMSSIFIPLTFIAGIYGMNFQYMPELSWEKGYFFTLGIMTMIIVAMIFYFRKKKWM